MTREITKAMIKACGLKLDATYTDLPASLYSVNDPTPVADPHVIVVNHDLAQAIGLDFFHMGKKEQADLFAGNCLLAGFAPFSQAYAGHQFGHFTMLGDGRAHVLAEHLSPKGDRVDIQFKGSGRTPYSRRGDGRAALGPMLREYIISEALFHLGIPTTRSLAVVSTGEVVMRETALPGAVLTRVASSHIRVGTFEYAASINEKETIGSLLEYTIRRHYPDLITVANKAVALLQAVMERQIDLVIHWMRVGFIHGVMNTDNMALSGESIDFGPCAFMDMFNPDQVFSSIDQYGRYAYSNQPKIIQWNLARLAESLLPFIHDDAQKAVNIAEEIIHQCSEIYQFKWLNMMRSKLGLFGEQEEDEQLISDLLGWMRNSHADYTNIFRDLSRGEQLDDQLGQEEVFQQWYQRYQKRLSRNNRSLKDSLHLMKSVNPVVIPRNHQVEKALHAAESGDLSVFFELLEALKEPYKSKESRNKFEIPPTASERVYQTFCGT